MACISIFQTGTLADQIAGTTSSAYSDMLLKQQNNLQAEMSNKNAIDIQSAQLKQEITDIQNQEKSIMQQIDTNQNTITQLQKEIDANTVLMKQRMRSMYMEGSASFIDVLLDSDSATNFLDRIEFMKTVKTHDDNLLQTIKNQEQSVRDNQKILIIKKDALSKLEGDALAKEEILKQQQEQSDAAIKQLQDSVDKTKTDAELNAEAETAATATNALKQTSEINQATIGQSATVINFAENFVGYPYVFGTAGPTTFDCSGFTQFVYAHTAGVSLPHSAAEQASCGTLVSRNDLQAGDLIFFGTDGSNISHVGIYIGSGKFVNAENERVGVINDSLNGSWSSKYVTARRVLS